MAVRFAVEWGCDRFKVGNDAIDMEVNDGLLAFGTEEEGAVGGVVH